VIVVLASRHDAGARRLVEQWAAQDAHLLTCDDLSAAGWLYSPGDRAAGTAVISGRVVPMDNIRGVVTRLSWVTERELVAIAEGDRGYVAAEMSAFLVAWLSDLVCPVLNRPTATSLIGPALRREQWIRLAREVGVRVLPETRCVRLGGAAEARPLAACTVWVIGERCLGEAAPVLLQQSRKLAGAINVAMLGVCFTDAGSDAAMVETLTYPDLDREEVTDAMLDYILARDRPDASN
jgi:hypothetical protein